MIGKKVVEGDRSELHLQSVQKPSNYPKGCVTLGLCGDRAEDGSHIHPLSFSGASLRLLLTGQAKGLWSSSK